MAVEKGAGQNTRIEPITFENLQSMRSRKARKQRLTAQRRDEFGRQYTVQLDLNTEPLAMTGLLERRFTAPVVVPQEYYSAREEGSAGSDILDINWRAWVNQVQADEGRWEQNAREIQRKRNSDLALDAPLTREVLTLAGPKPLPLSLALLTVRGDPWCLGFQERRTPAVESVIGREEPKPLTSARDALAAAFVLPPELEALLGENTVDARGSYAPAPRDPYRGSTESAGHVRTARTAMAEAQEEELEDDDFGGLADKSEDEIIEREYRERREIDRLDRELKESRSDLNNTLLRRHEASNSELNHELSAADLSAPADDPAPILLVGGEQVPVPPVTSVGVPQATAQSVTKATRQAARRGEG